MGKTWIRGIAVAAAAAALPMVLAGQAGATTTAFPNDSWDISNDVSPVGLSSGGVIWSNRSAVLQGSVEDFGGNFATRVYFTAYAGDTKVDGDGRTAGPGKTVPFKFSIGDPDRVGGFDRLSIQVCELGLDGPQLCSPGVNLHRDDLGERRVWRP
ncbi:MULTISPECIES: hypothetical protein [unclassified Amycolatopsis]|uniref:hypothetical protein n=1 Tax=unclassified Amycolatopsis TaxID=2618356 RepID=UPI00287660DC|nr:MULTISPECIES: hypothetical protein [unclassified Amycolatopsis]MDS0134578.1 hypothetical protein [Amycolatopsis sp. 505]MDS0147523.1 hypothetical protein [Amycolatopsis sp. CM201R]